MLFQRLVWFFKTTSIIGSEDLRRESVAIHWHHHRQWIYQRLQGIAYEGNCLFYQ